MSHNQEAQSYQYDESPETQQLEEIEVLKAIYQEHEFQVLNNQYPEIELRFDIVAKNEDENVVCPRIEITVLAEFPAQYPREKPSIRLLGIDDLFSEERIQELYKCLDNAAEEHVGMPMMYDIIYTLEEETYKLTKEFLHRMDEDKRVAQRKVEEKQRKKFEGTPVTPESFMDWKINFDKERSILKDQQRKDREAFLAGRLTGKEQFLQDATLGVSDVALIKAKEVDINEALFVDEDFELDGLDMNDED